MSGSEGVKMEMKNKLWLLLFLLSLLVFSNGSEASSFIGHREEDVSSVYDQEGNYVFGTAMGVSAGDIYISEDNIEYLIETVNGSRAIAKKVGEVDLMENFSGKAGILTPIAAQGKKLIGIYHTHNGESYLPGPENVEGHGEIHTIGRELSKALEQKGIEVSMLDNLHLPHDGAAYTRSRATALDLARKGPDAIFDVHRDAVPRKEEYLKNVNGQLVSQVRFVVGRQNPNKKVNDKFARQLKAVADKKYPGLVKGIFYGRGTYNQEISPRSLLLEFGSHVTTKEQAGVSTQMMADTISSLLYGEEGEAVKTGDNRSAFSTIAWIVGILIVAILVFLLINEGSWAGVIKRIKGFFGREIFDRGNGN